MGWKPAPPFIAFSIFIFRTDIKLPEREVLCRGKILGEADAFPLGVLAARGCLGVPQDPWAWGVLAPSLASLSTSPSSRAACKAPRPFAFAICRGK